VDPLYRQWTCLRPLSMSLMHPSIWLLLRKLIYEWSILFATHW
jgi:hypothetical protein